MAITERANTIVNSRKVAIVNDWLTVHGGAEDVLQAVHSMFPSVPIFAAQFNDERIEWLKGRDVRTHWINKLPFSKTKHYLYAPILADVYRSFNLHKYDLVVTLSHTFAHNTKPRRDAVNFCYYHSPARSLWFPEIDNRAGSGFLRERVINRLKRLDKIASKNHTYAVANSWTTAHRLEAVYHRPVEKVIYPAVDVDKWIDTPRNEDSEGYTMWSRLIPYKKFDLAIAAAKMGGFKLNIVGSGPFEQTLKQQAEGLSNITFHGRLPDAELKILLSQSRGVLFPAYEDFGIVPIEAMAAGLPVVVFDKGGASETVTEEYGEQITEQTPEQIISAIQRLEGRQFDPEILKERARGFGIARFQEEFLTSIEEAIERGPTRPF
jgi:glycosyltransferase involved in cell wall biosynthesis